MLPVEYRLTSSFGFWLKLVCLLVKTQRGTHFGVTFEFPNRHEEFYSRENTLKSEFCCGATGLLVSLEHWDAGSIPSPAVWVKDPALL